MTRQELRTLVKLLGKLEHPERGLPQEVFDALVRVVPFIACELVVISPQEELLLVWRDDQYWKGWHFPGGLLRYRECWEERIQSVAQQELGVKIKKWKFLFAVNHPNTVRGHGVSLVWLCRAAQPPKAGKFFSRMPADIISAHRQMWKKVRVEIRAK